MHVIGHAAYLERYAAVIPHNAPEIRMKTFGNACGDEWLTMFGAEHDMNLNGGE